MATRRRDRGAAAVEMAIVLPLLLLLVGGIIDFGRAFYYQVSISNAAREGARMKAIGGFTNAQVDARVQGALPAIPTSEYTITQGACTVDASGVKVVDVTVRVDPYRWLIVRDISKFFGGALPLPTYLQAKGSMRCEQ